MYLYGVYMTTLRNGDKIWQIDDCGDFHGWSALLNHHHTTVNSAVQYCHGQYHGACLVRVDGKIVFDSMFRYGKYHGISKTWNGGVLNVRYFNNSIDITSEITDIVSQLPNPSVEEQLFLGLKYGFEFNTFTFDEIYDIITDDYQGDL